MTITQLLLFYVLTSMVSACTRTMWLLHAEDELRRGKRNFRTFRVRDVATYSLTVSAIMTALVVVFLADPIFTILLAGAFLGHRFQRAIEA